jgi:hypothetical protein
MIAQKTIGTFAVLKTTAAKLSMRYCSTKHLLLKMSDNARDGESVLVVVLQLFRHRSFRDFAIVNFFFLVMNKKCIHNKCNLPWCDWKGAREVE